MFKRPISWIVLITFVVSLIVPYKSWAVETVVNLPAPGTMVNLSSVFEPVLIKGLTIHKDNPFMFDFVVDTGNSNLSSQDKQLKSEADRLIKYFFACLTIPEKNLWVNLSPYEKDRMAPEALGQTALGRDLLAEDYILKQLTASLIYPEKDLGKEFWNRVYAKAQQMYGSTDIPVNTFNKVWILADKATVYEHGQTAFVVDGHLKVMLEEDYEALHKNSLSAESRGSAENNGSRGITTEKSTHTLASQIVRDIVLPEIEKEVNTGKNFSTLRQIFNSLILASWYKKNLKESLLNQIYADKSTVKGVNLEDPSVKEQIYQQYLQAYKKGVFNYIKEDPQVNGQAIPRKYFSGGFGVNEKLVNVDNSMAAASRISRAGAMVDFAVVANANSSVRSDAAMLTEVQSAWSKYGLTDLLRNVLMSLDGLGKPYGLATIHTRDLVKFNQKSDIQPKLYEQIARLFRDDKNIGRLIIDGEEQKVVNPEGDFVVSATSLDSSENLYYGKADGTNFTVYKRSPAGLQIVTSVHIQWGSDVRVLISTDEGAFDYKLTEDGSLRALSPNGIQMEHNGSFISLGGNTATWPSAMQAFVNERLSKTKTKERHSGSDGVDIYYMMSKVGLMTGWVSLSEAHAIAHLMSKAKGLAKIQTPEGLKDIQSTVIQEKDILRNEQVYIYAGVTNLVESAEAFINPRADRQVGITQDRSEEKPKANDVKIRETLKEYVAANLKVSTLPEMSEAERDRLEVRMKRLVERIVDAFLNDISLDAIEHHEGQSEIIGKLQKELTLEERKIFFKKNGVRHIHGLDWILKNLPNQERAVGKNISGDQQKLLDFVFNQILKYIMRFEVHAIISEEDDDIIYGSGESSALTDSVRIVNFLDPIDGSSQIKEGGAFGSIFTFGYLKKGQRIDDGTFDPRTQLLASLDMSFGPNTLLTLINPSNAQNHPEIVQFVLTNTNSTPEFRRELEYHNMSESELNNSTWEGAVPKADKDSILLLARGGSLEEAKVPGHRQFVQALERRYGVVPIYSGALASEMRHILLAHDISAKKITGALYFYASNKLRHLFEGIFYAKMTALSGGETIDGHQPLLNLPLKAPEGKSLSGKSMPFYSGSSWMTKLMMSWSYYIQKYSVEKGAKLTEEELDAKWDEFFSFYLQRTTKLIEEVSKVSNQSQDTVRKALLSYDSIDMQKHYYPRLLEESAQEVAKKLTFDAAMTVSQKKLYLSAQIASFHDLSGVKEVADYLNAMPKNMPKGILIAADLDGKSLFIHSRSGDERVLVIIEDGKVTQESKQAIVNAVFEINQETSGDLKVGTKIRFIEKKRPIVLTITPEQRVSSRIEITIKDGAVSGTIYKKNEGKSIGAPLSVEGPVNLKLDASEISMSVDSRRNIFLKHNRGEEFIRVNSDTPFERVDAAMNVEAGSDSEGKFANILLKKDYRAYYERRDKKKFIVIVEDKGKQREVDNFIQAMINGIRRTKVDGVEGVLGNVKYTLTQEKSSSAEGVVFGDRASLLTSLAKQLATGEKKSVETIWGSAQEKPIKYTLTKTDAAMAGQVTPGGIDLNSANMGMTVTKDANGGVQVNFDPALLDRIKAQGIYSVVPVIINITPMTDIRPLLGLAAQPAMVS